MGIVTPELLLLLQENKIKVKITVRSLVILKCRLSLLATEACRFNYAQDKEYADVNNSPYTFAKASVQALALAKGRIIHR